MKLQEATDELLAEPGAHLDPQASDCVRRVNIGCAWVEVIGKCSHRDRATCVGCVARPSAQVEQVVVGYHVEGTANSSGWVIFVADRSIGYALTIARASRLYYQEKVDKKGQA